MTRTTVVLLVPYCGFEGGYATAETTSLWGHSDGDVLP
jgi:hypothetical protein